MMKNDLNQLNIGAKINTNNCHLQQLTTQQIIRTVLSSDRPLSFLNQQKQQRQSEQLQQQILKSKRAVIELENIPLYNLENKMYLKFDSIKENEFKNIHKNCRYLEKQDENNLSQNHYELNQDNIQINRKIQDQQKSIKQHHQLKVWQTQNTQLNKSYEFINHQDKSRQNFLTKSIEQEEWNMKKNKYENQNSKLNNQIKQNDNNILSQENLHNQQTTLDLIENSSYIQLYPNNHKQNQFIRKNSRKHMLRRSVIDLLHPEAEDNQSQQMRNQSEQMRNQKIRGEMYHSVSQGEVGQGLKEKKILDQMVLQQNKITHRNSIQNIYPQYNSHQQSISDSLDNINMSSNDIALNNQIDKINENSFDKIYQYAQDKCNQDFYHQRKSKQLDQNNSYSQIKNNLNNQKPKKQNLQNFRSKNSLQDLYEKKKQDEHNELELGLNDFLKQQQKLKEQSEQYSIDQSLEQQNLDQLKQNMNEKIQFKFKSNNKLITKLQPKTSRLYYNKNNQSENNNQVYIKERQFSIDNSSIQLIKEPWQIPIVPWSQNRNEKDELIQLKEVQLFNNSQRFNSHKKIRSISQDSQFIQENPKNKKSQKENEMPILQQKYIQELINSLNKKTINQSKQEYKIQIGNRKNTKKQNGINNQQNQNMSNNFQFQPIQSVNLQKYNEFKLNKQKREFSIQYKEDSSEHKEDIYFKDDKCFQDLVEEYDPQNISLLKNKLQINNLKDDKHFFVNQFQQMQYYNIINNPIINQNYKEEKMQQIRNIRNNYNFKLNQLIKKNSNYSSQKIQNENKLNFSAWNNEIDMYQREELEDIKLLDDYNKKIKLFK